MYANDSQFKIGRSKNIPAVLHAGIFFDRYIFLNISNADEWAFGCGFTTKYIVINSIYRW